MARYIDAFFAPMLLIMCLSHAAQPRLWADFFLAMKRTGLAPLIIGMYTLPVGLLLVVGHNLWVWDWPVFITVFGWAMTVKATIYLLFPAVPNYMIDNAERWEKRIGGYRVAGVIGAVLAAFLTWQAYGHLPA